MTTTYVPGDGPSSGYTKIGTADFTGRVVSGLVPHDRPDSVELHQLYPDPCERLGVIDHIGAANAELKILPRHRDAWSDAERTALAEFFSARHRDHHRLAVLLNITSLLGEAANGR
ncbi:hypothetical protein AB0B28_05955 [Glycomyces sp. NPDC046736]|uniref:hypothetical protein n=1 Tax=Glycomyces sp. NPDC046736 TaxID=3155615 RepID=UPI0033DF73FA